MSRRAPNTDERGELPGRQGLPPTMTVLLVPLRTGTEITDARPITLGGVVGATVLNVPIGVTPTRR